LKHLSDVKRPARIAGVVAVGVLAGLAVARADTTADEEAAPPEIPAGTSITNIVIVEENIFDLSKEGENYWLYRWMNRLHIVTKPKTIRRQLLFSEGDGYDQRVVEETERILRQNKYIYDASIEPAINPEGDLEIEVHTRDLWTLTPELTLSREGGENKTEIGIEESNLFGTGQQVVITHTDDVERSGNIFEFFDRQLGASWVSMRLLLADNSDGHSRQMSVIKPFHSLDARNAGGITLYDDDRRSTFYELGDEAAEYRHERRFARAFFGRSGGLRGSWVQRWTAGVVFDDNVFSQVAEPELPPAVPPDRKLVYPFLGFEVLEDHFETSQNTNQIDRSEDFYLGTRVAASLGWSDTSFGADRDALVFAADGNHSIGSLNSKALLLSARFNGRHEDGDFEDTKLGVTGTYYWKQSDKRLFYVGADATIGHNLDPDDVVEIGGDSGLRGYPLRYEAGDSSLVVSVEQRYYTDWYPWRLFRVGGAVFADVGRVWGPDPLGIENSGWLKDVGIGLRLAPTRLGTNKVIHIDIAFPLDGDDDIDSVQVLVEAKRSF